MMEILRFAVPAPSSWHMFMTGEVFGAQKALQLGVVHEIVAPEKLLERAIEKATYSKLSMTTYPSIKAMLQRPTIELFAKHSEFTKSQMEKDYGIVKAKL